MKKREEKVISEDTAERALKDAGFSYKRPKKACLLLLHRKKKNY
jgi:hypothetical protein